MCRQHDKRCGYEKEVCIKPMAGRGDGITHISHGGQITVNQAQEADPVSCDVVSLRMWV